jgi:hypothetical protein
MYNISNVGGKTLESRTKVEFPLALAVDNVELFKVEPNPNIKGLAFSFKRTQDKVVVDGATVDTISFITDSVLHPNIEYCKGGKILADGKVQTIEQEYDGQVRQFMGYVRNIATTCGISNAELDAIGNCESYEEFADKFCKVVNDADTTTKVYLKTVKDKSGYTKLPRYRGNGVVQKMADGYPEKWEYSPYELQMIEAAGATGVTVQTKAPINFDDI